MRTPTLLLCLLVAPVVVASPQSPRQSRTGQIVAAFTKQKHVVAMKHGVRREKYKDVRAEPVVRANVRDYAGRYENTDLDWWIDVQVMDDGRIQASGSEAGREFALQDATIAGSLITATKRYRDGRAERLEGVFLNRTERTNPADPGVTAFGLGVMLASPAQAAGNTFDKVFYRLMP